MPFLKTNGAELYYELHGEKGPVLTFVCGITRTLEDYKAFTRRLVPLGYRVLLFDNRGAGKTKVSAPFTLKEMAQDIVDLWEEEGISQGILIGFSLGGIISSQVAIAHPTRVKALIIISSSLYPEYLNRQVMMREDSSNEEIEESLPLYFSAKYRAKHELFVSAFAKKLLREHYQSQLHESVVLQRKALDGNTVSENIKTIKHPVLLVHGTEDAVVSVKSSARAVNEMPNARLIEFPEAGHMLLVEETEKLFNVLVDYLSSVASQ